MKRIILPSLFLGLWMLVSCVERSDQLKDGSKLSNIEAQETIHVDFPQVLIDTVPSAASDYYLKSGLPQLKEPGRMKRILLQRSAALEEELEYFVSPRLSQFGASCDSAIRYPLEDRPFKREFTLREKTLNGFSAKEKIGFTLGYPEEEIQNCEYPGYDVGQIEAISPRNHSIGYGIGPSFRQYKALKRDSISVQKELHDYLVDANSISDAMVDLIVNAQFYSLYPILVRIYRAQPEPDDLILTALLDGFGYSCDDVGYRCIDKRLKNQLIWDKHGNIVNNPKNVDRIIKYVLDEGQKRTNGKGK